MSKDIATLPAHMSSVPVISGVRGPRSIIFYVLFCRSRFVHFPLVLAVILQFMNSDYPHGIFKLFFIPVSDGRCELTLEYIMCFILTI